MLPNSLADPIGRATIARAQAGNAAAIGEIYEHFHADVFRFLYYRVNDRQVAEDLTAEVFLKLIAALPGYRSTGAPFRAWLFQIARNLAVDHYRRSAHRDHLDLEPGLADPGESPASQVERSLVSDHLVRALNGLTEDQRDVLILRFITQMPILHVAQVLGKSETAVKALQRRGLQALRATLEKWNVTDG